MRFFVYGQLKNYKKPDSNWVAGELRRRPDDDCAAKFDSKSKARVYGQVKEYSAEEYRELEKIEKPDEYRRAVVRLQDGSHAYAWEFAGPKKQWDSFKPIPSGKYKP